MANRTAEINGLTDTYTNVYPRHLKSSVAAVITAVQRAESECVLMFLSQTQAASTGDVMLHKHDIDLESLKGLMLCISLPCALGHRCSLNQ